MEIKKKKKNWGGDASESTTTGTSGKTGAGNLSVVARIESAAPDGGMPAPSMKSKRQFLSFRFFCLLLFDRPVWCPGVPLVLSGAYLHSVFRSHRNVESMGSGVGMRHISFFLPLSLSLFVLFYVCVCVCLFLDSMFLAHPRTMIDVTLRKRIRERDRSREIEAERERLVTNQCKFPCLEKL